MHGDVLEQMPTVNLRLTYGHCLLKSGQRAAGMAQMELAAAAHDAEPKQITKAIDRCLKARGADQAERILDAFETRMEADSVAERRAQIEALRASAA